METRGFQDGDKIADFSSAASKVSIFQVRPKPRSNKLASYSSNTRSRSASAFASKASTKNWLTFPATTHLPMVGSCWQTTKIISRDALLYTRLAAQQLISTPPEVAAFEFAR